MNPELWETLEDLFVEASALPIHDQTGFVQERTMGNKELEEELNRMLEGHRRTSVLDTSIGLMLNDALRQPEVQALERIGPYSVMKRLGEGGMGVVYLASRDDWNILVAIKLPRDAWISPDRFDRFQSEQRLLAQLTHPVIARIYEGGTQGNGTPWFAMEYVEGEPITESCRSKDLPAFDRMRLFQAVCDAVQYAHSQLIVHRDLKPSNIFVTGEGKVKLLDFGIAKQIRAGISLSTITRTGLHPVTLAYAAPEQITSNEVSIQTDIYALGVLLYELLTNTLPFDLAGLNALQASEFIRKTEPPKPSFARDRVPGLTNRHWDDLNVLILKAMHKDVGQRYRTADALMQDVQHFLADEPLRARPDSAAYRTRKFIKRNRKPISFAAAVLVLLIGIIGFYTVRLTRARDAALTQATRAERTKGLLLKVLGGDFDEAPSANFRVVDALAQAVKEAHLLNNEPEVQADLYQTLGEVYHNLSEFDTADGLLHEAIAKRRSLFGKDDIKSGEASIALASLRIDQARYAEAEQLAQSEMEIARRKLPSTQKLFDESMTILGSALARNGHISESIDVLQKAIQLETGKPDQESLLSESLAFLANSYMFSGKYIAAEPLHRRALELDRRLDGDRSPGVAQDLSNLSQIQIKRGRYAQAEQNAREALAIDRGWYRQENVEVALLEECLAESLIYTGKLEEASRLLPSAMHALEAKTGKTNPYLAYGLDLSGRMALRRGNVKQAEADFRQMQDIYTAVFQPSHRYRAVGPWRMGELYAAKNELSNAEASFRASLDKLTAALGADNPYTGSARIELGGVLLREHKKAEAEAELQRGYAALTREGDISMQLAVQARKDLTKLHVTLRSGPTN